MASMSLDTLFNIRPIGVVSNRLNGFLKMRELINSYNFSAGIIVPNEKVIDDAIDEKTKKKFSYHKYTNEIAYARRRITIILKIDESHN